MHLGSKCFKSTYCTYFRSDFVHILLSPNYATNIYYVRFILQSKLDHKFCRKNPKYFAVYEFDSLHHKNRCDKKKANKNLVINLYVWFRQQMRDKERKCTPSANVKNAFIIIVKLSVRAVCLKALFMAVFSIKRC